MKPKRKLAGQRFGNLTVINLHSRTAHGNRKWKCRCDCGNETVVVGSNLANGQTRSCGCLRKAQGRISAEHQPRGAGGFYVCNNS